MGSSPTTPASRLPDDLILSIFLDNNFPPSDLSRLCLVSNRFFPSVQRSLYRLITVTSIFSSPSEIFNIRWNKVTRGTLALVELLEKNWELAKLVKTIEFRGVEAGDISELSEFNDEELVPRCGFLTRLLHLAENCERVEFGKGYEMISPVRDLLDDFRHRIKQLSLVHCYQKDVHYLAESFPHLLRLEIDYLSLHPIVPLPSSTSFNLEELHIGDVTGSGSLVQFVMDSKTTLRKVSLPLETALNLDYSELGKLTNLKIVDSNSSSQRSIPASFWFNISRCTSLETLTLPGSTSSAPEEEDILSQLDVNQAPYHRLRSLRTLRFTDDFSLDQISNFLSWPISDKLDKIVVPFPSINQGLEQRRRSQRIEMLKVYCEGVGMRVCLKD
ncbi:hypothetical protein JCM5350_008348 [Sporobolomyces pararoseus]